MCFKKNMIIQSIFLTLEVAPDLKCVLWGYFGDWLKEF